MPRVKFITPVATVEQRYHAGDVADVSGANASAWAKNGNVEIVRSESVSTPEAATESVETTVTKPARRSRKSD